MIYRKKVKIIFFVGLFFIIMGLVLALPEKVGLCDIGDLTCIRHYVYNFDDFATFFVIFSVPIILISFILFFLSEQACSSWLRFAKYYLPIAAVLIFLFPAVDSSILGFDREFMTWFFAGVFFLWSLGIIIFKRKNVQS